VNIKNVVTSSIQNVNYIYAFLENWKRSGSVCLVLSGKWKIKDIIRRWLSSGDDGEVVNWSTRKTVALNGLV